MAAFAEDVEFGADAGFVEGDIIEDGVLVSVLVVVAAASVVLGDGEESGGSLFGDFDFGLEAVGAVFQGEIARINGQGDIGARGLWRVLLVYGVVGKLIEVGGDAGDEAAAGGEADDADSIGIDLPLGGHAADEAEGPLGVLHGDEFLGLTLVGRDAVFDDDGGDSFAGKPLGDGGAFFFDDDFAESAAGEDEEGGAGIFARVWCQTERVGTETFVMSRPMGFSGGGWGIRRGRRRARD